MLEKLAKIEIDKAMQKQNISTKMLKEVETSVKKKWKEVKRPQSKLEDDWYTNMEDKFLMKNTDITKKQLNYSSMSDKIPHTSKASNVQSKQFYSNLFEEDVKEDFKHSLDENNNFSKLTIKNPMLNNNEILDSSKGSPDLHLKKHAQRNNSLEKNRNNAFSSTRYIIFIHIYN